MATPIAGQSARRAPAPAASHDRHAVEGGELPDVFQAVAPDDAVAPHARAGQVVYFDRTAKPKPGDGVLVRALDGKLYLRIYAATGAAEWSAVATSNAFQSFHSFTDGLELVATATHVGRPFGG